jgi:hypothetical protein
MEVHHDHIKLTTSEIGCLWSTYMESTAIRCFYQHFQQHLKDPDITLIIGDILTFINEVVSTIKDILTDENIPVPKGFSGADVDLSAPALYTDPYALSFLYRGSQIIILHYTNVLTKVTRNDIYKFYEKSLFTETKLHKKSVDLMSAKGFMDRPPKMEYPTSINFADHNKSLIKSLLGDKRPLNTIEIGELFLAVERNAIGLILIMGLVQVAKDKEIKQYLLDGKKLAEKQLGTYQKLLKENDDFMGFPITLEVTNSTITPFSEKLILFFISSSNGSSIDGLGHALSITRRKDLGVIWSSYITEIMKYMDVGGKIMIERGWMEQPPQPVDRKKQFYKT